MISEIDIRDWDKVERIIESLDVIDHDQFKSGSILFEDYRFIIDLVNQVRKQYPQVPVLFRAPDRYDERRIEMGQ